MAVILLLYPLRHAMTGVDLMDAGYALGNYRFFDTMNETWKLATYLANVVGMVLMQLPMGNTWIGMNIYTGLLIGITAAGVYLFMERQYGERWRMFRYLLFAAELAALSLCWAPSVILYHYLGYIMMTAASIVLFQAITKDNGRYYIAAGIILGLCVAVRMPNITYMAFILPVWYFFFLKRKEYEGALKKAFNRTLLCIAGYLAGLLVPILFICLRYGFHAYPEMISSLFGMTGTATDYKPISMIMAMFGDYINYSVWLLLFLAYMAAGFVFFAMKKMLVRSEKTKAAVYAFRGIYLAGFLVLLRFCYGRGMFNFDYTAYLSIYKWVTVYLLVTIALCIWILIRKSADQTLKLWSVFMLVTIFITPLGSNNGLYPIINNLFLAAPVSVLFLLEAFRAADGIAEKYKKAEIPFVLKAVVCFVTVCTLIQSVFFGIGFVFHDTKAIGEERVTLRLQSGTAVNGLRTTASKAEQLEELDRFLTENNLTLNSVILYGDVPALAYIFDMESAVFTTWADLDSNALARLEQDLDKIDGAYPVVILGETAVRGLTGEDGMSYKKLITIKDFMQKNHYTEVYTGDAYRVFVKNDNRKGI